MSEIVILEYFVFGRACLLKNRGVRNSRLAGLLADHL